MDGRLVDDREPDWLVDYCVEDLDCVENRMDTGDVILGHFVVERKEASDFFNSLYKGRLESQLMSMVSGDLRPIVLLEGDFKDALMWIQARPPRVLSSYHGMGAKMSALGVQVFHVFDQEGVKQFLRKLAELAEADEVGLEQPVSKIKTHGPEIAALAQIPGVGTTTAEEIHEELGPIADMCELHLFEIEEATGEKTAENIWRMLHDEDVPKVYDKLGRGKRAQKLVERYPEVEDGAKVPRDIAEDVLGGWADHLEELLIDVE